MGSHDSRLRKLLPASAFALLAFCVGYFTPHNSAALAQAPLPGPSVIDDVPGGGHANGKALVTNATVTASSIQIASKSGWACAKSNHCAVTFAFRMAPGGAPTQNRSSAPARPTAFRLAAAALHTSRRIRLPYSPWRRSTTLK